MKKAILIIIVIIISLAGWMLGGFNQQNIRFDPERFIAHAAGAIDNYKYTNSLEALEQSIARGFKYIEIDLLMTSDSVVVAGHSWLDFNKMTRGEESEKALSLNEFHAKKIYGKYTPMSYIQIDSVFKANPDLYFVTDKISDPNILSKFFPDLKNRMCVEVFGGFNEYLELENQGFYRPMLSGFPNLEYGYARSLLRKDTYKIKYIACYYKAINNYKAIFQSKITGAKLAAFTTNDTEWMDKYLGKRADMVYTDSYIVNEGRVAEGEVIDIKIFKE